MTAPGPDPLPPVAFLPTELQRELRSDHAGETGAVYLYRGILAMSKDPSVITMATEHLEQEEQHLGFFDAWLTSAQISLFIPVWRLAGWTLGAIAALAGPAAVYLTIDAVEEFVVEHYGQQLHRLADQERWQAVSTVLEQFCRDEQNHRNDAIAQAKAQQPSFTASLWRGIVNGGSRIAVSIAKTL
ncbi:MAG: demethoxyubiquinone hydroxylase family protein [Pseudomonadota bacterium]